MMLRVGLAAAAAVLLFGAGWAARDVIADRDIAEMRELHAQAAQRAEADARKAESFHRERADRATTELAQTKERLASIERRAAARTERVLVAADAWDCTPTASDSIPAASGDTASLRELLEPILLGYAEAVRAAETHAADVRALLEAWPVKGKP